MLRDTSSAVESAAGALKASSDSKKAEESEKAKAESPAASTGPAETTAAQAQPQVQAQAAREDLSGPISTNIPEKPFNMGRPRIGIPTGLSELTPSAVSSSGLILSAAIGVNSPFAVVP